MILIIYKIRIKHLYLKYRYVININNEQNDFLTYKNNFFLIYYLILLSVSLMKNCNLSLKA